MMGSATSAATNSTTFWEEVRKNNYLQSLKSIESMTNIIECLLYGQIFEEVINFYERYISPVYLADNPEQTLVARADLALAFANCGREGWEGMMKRCLTEMTNLKGEGDIETLGYMHRFASMYFRYGDPEKAWQVGRQCCEIMVAEWGDHPETKALLKDLEQWGTVRQ